MVPPFDLERKADENSVFSLQRIASKRLGGCHHSGVRREVSATMDRSGKGGTEKGRSRTKRRAAAADSNGRKAFAVHPGSQHPVRLHLSVEMYNVLTVQYSLVFISGTVILKIRSSRRPIPVFYLSTCVHRVTRWIYCGQR